MAATTAGTTLTATAHGGRPAPARHGTLLDAVPRSGVLRVCTTGDYLPYSHRDPKTGDYRGIDIDMARDLAQSLDAKAEFTPTTWSGILGDLTAGHCDIAMGGVSVTLPRARAAAFSEPYRTDGKTPITRCADQDDYTTLERIDRPGVRVVVNPGGTNEAFARAHLHRATIVVHPDNTTIFDEIVAGRADVMITDASETLYQAKLHPQLCAVHPDHPFTFAEKAYLLPRGDREFEDYVDQWVHLRTHDGTYQRFAAPWQ
nr:transporter substrate-binding domain-containing protein [Streptomyces sp. SID5468]